MRLYRTKEGEFVARKDHAKGGEVIDFPSNLYGIIDWLNANVAKRATVIVETVDHMGEEAFARFAETRPEPQRNGHRYVSPFDAATTVQRIDASMIADAVGRMEDGKAVARVLEAVIDRLGELKP